MKRAKTTAATRCFLGNIFLRPRVLSVFVEYWWSQLDFIDTFSIPHKTFETEIERRFYNLISLFTSTLDDIILSGQRHVIVVMEDSTQHPTGRIGLVFRNLARGERQDQHFITIGDQLCLSVQPWSTEIDARGLPLGLATLVMDPGSYWEERIDANMNGHFCFTKFKDATTIGASIIQPTLIFTMYVQWILVKEMLKETDDLLEIIKTCGTLLKQAVSPGWWWSPLIPQVEQTLTRELADILLTCKTKENVMFMAAALADFHKRMYDRAVATFREITSLDTERMPCKGVASNPYLLYDTLTKTT